MDRRFSSLASCYALFAALAASFLVYAHLALQGHQGDWLNGSLLPHEFRAAQLLVSIQGAAAALRERMHTTWLFFTVFAAVWFASLLWMQIERRRRRLKFTLREAYWMGWITLSVFSAAVLYGLGTNGILPRRFPGIVPVSDVAALAFMLALPVVAWSQLRGQEEETPNDSEDTALPRRNSGFLGLNDDEMNDRLMERLEVRPEVRPVDLLPAVQIFHPELAGEHARTAASWLIESAELPALPPSPNPEPSQAPIAVTTDKTTMKGIDAFRNNLSNLNASWQRIETIRGEIDDWFEQRRRQAIAHLDTHPGMRSSALAGELFQNFPNEKLAAVDTEWAEIRSAALEISRWFGDIPSPEAGK